MKTELIKISFFLMAIVISANAFAGKIQTCKADGSFCLAQVPNGTVGDQVRILDEKASQVASGRIEKKNSTVVLIHIENKIKIPKRGYPVFVKAVKKNNATQWADSFSNSNSVTE